MGGRTRRLRRVGREIATGAKTRVASALANALLNGTIVDGTTVLVTDSLYDLVWQAPVDGTGEPLTVWKDDPLFKVPPGAPFPGPNGISIFHGPPTWRFPTRR